MWPENILLIWESSDSYYVIFEFLLGPCRQEVHTERALHEACPVPRAAPACAKAGRADSAEVLLSSELSLKSTYQVSDRCSKTQAKLPAEAADSSGHSHNTKQHKNDTIQNNIKTEQCSLTLVNHSFAILSDHTDKNRHLYTNQASSLCLLILHITFTELKANWKTYQHKSKYLQQRKRTLLV